MNNNKIIIAGIIPPLVGKGEHIHIEDYVYDSQGIAPTLTARDYKDPRRVLVIEDNDG